MFICGGISWIVADGTPGNCIQSEVENIRSCSSCVGSFILSCEQYEAMGYHFRLVGCSKLDFVADVPRETRKLLYAYHGSEGACSAGIAKTNVFYFRLCDNVFGVKTDNSTSVGFAYGGSWRGRTVESFFDTMRRYAYNNGLSYTCPLFCGSTGAISAADCATYAREFDEILQALSAKPAPTVSVPPPGGEFAVAAETEPAVDAPSTPVNNGNDDDDDGASETDCSSLPASGGEHIKSMYYGWAKDTAAAFALAADGGICYVETI